MPPVLSTNNYLFIGNPGGGKSTLLNGLAGKVLFKSGEKIGSGVTKKLQTIELPGKGVFMDTPGLAECKKELREQAAVEITEALQKNGNYRIFFVVTLEAGRARAGDVATICLVMDALKNIEGVCYSIIINKLSPELQDALENNKDNCVDDLMACLMGDPPIKTQNIFYMEHNAELFGKKMYPDGTAEEQTIKYKLPEKLLDFIVCAPRVLVDGKKVEHVKADQFDELNAKLKVQMAELENNLVKQKEINSQMSGELKKQATLCAAIQSQAKIDRDNHAREIRETQRAHERAVAKQRQDNERERQRTVQSMNKANETTKNNLEARLKVQDENNTKNMRDMDADYRKRMDDLQKESETGGWTKYVEWIPVVGPVVAGVARICGAK